MFCLSLVTEAFRVQARRAFVLALGRLRVLGYVLSIPLHFLSQPALQLIHNYILMNYPKTNENLTFDPPYSNRDCGEFGCFVPNLDDIVRVTL